MKIAAGVRIYIIHYQKTSYNNVGGKLSFTLKAIRLFYSISKALQSRGAKTIIIKITIIKAFVGSGS